MNADKEVAELDLLRIALSGDGAKACQSIIERLKRESEHLKISPSRVMSVVVSRYYEKYFDSEIIDLVSLFFDPKEFLATEIDKTMSDAKLKEVLETALARLSRLETNDLTSKSERSKSPKKAGKLLKPKVINDNLLEKEEMIEPKRF